jgi:hypothetical protein
MTEYIEKQDLRVRVIRSPKRKTLALRVHQGEAVIRMPAKLNIRIAEDFVSNKSAWLKKQLSLHPAIELKRYISGQHLLFLGESLRLDVQTQQNESAIFTDHERLVIVTPKAELSEQLCKRQLTRWYRTQAEHYLIERCQEWATKTELFPQSVTVKTYRARWGSCNLRREIQFNWALIMAPPAVIDYVIVHELCHLVQHNHSPAFWQLVASFMPNFQTHRQWLKQYGLSLTL